MPASEDPAGPRPETLQIKQDQTPADPPTARPASGVDPATLLARIAALEAELATAHNGAQVIDLSDQRALQDVGIYRYHHPLGNAAAYKERLRSLEGQIDEVIKSSRAILAADMFTFDGSLARGRKLVGDLSKLMLRAYNAEADKCVRSLRSGNVRAARKRLESAVTAIEKLGVIMEMRINPEYHALRITELELTADFQMKAQEERERAARNASSFANSAGLSRSWPPRKSDSRRNEPTTLASWTP
ncbi:DUF4041 domain-containing protein [Streptomyces mirabilis]|uniref:DUF4041 domain-containing protein n=1 Tax=Streptomyces mirabilis TaxID=68239 RepID=UPI0033B4CA02